ncbi:MAG: MFS transporter [bacterium]|nr:MFS transporter [bacterium]
MSEFTPRRESGSGNGIDSKTDWALRRSIAEGSVAAVMGNLAGGVFLTGFALALGASEFHIGLLSSLPPIISLVQLFTPPILRRFGGKRKELTLFSFGAGRLLWLLLIILPFLVWLKHSMLPIWIIIGSICLSTGFNSIGAISWLSWMGDLVPRNRLGRYFSSRNLNNGVVGMLTAMAGGIVFDLWKDHTSNSSEIYGFAGVFLIGLGFGVLSLFFMKGIPEPGLRIQPRKATPWKEWLIPFKDRNFRAFIIVRMFWLFSVGFAAPYFSVYLIKNLKLDYSSIQFFNLIATAGSLYCMRFWGRLIDHFGNRPLLILSNFMKALYPLSWLLVTPKDYWIMLPIAQLLCSFDSGINLSSSNMLLKLSPKGDNTVYLSTYTACMNLSLAISPLIGGWAVTRFAQNDIFTFGSYQIEALKVLFLVSGTLRLLTIPLFYRIREQETATLGHMFRVLREIKGFVPNVGELNETFAFWFAPVTDMMYVMRSRSRQLRHRLRDKKPKIYKN